MKQFAILVLSAVVLLSSRTPALAAAATIDITPERCVIVLSADAKTYVQAAAEELQKHLNLITGGNVPIVQPGQADNGRYLFHVGIRNPSDDQPLASEEARWQVLENETYLYGNERHVFSTLSAVCGFLESQLNVRWLFAGDRGIAYTPTKTLRLHIGSNSWRPQLQLRKIRPDARVKQYPVLKDYVAEFATFLRGHEEHDQYARDVRQWQLRMRMGSHTALNYGHAFTGWWDRFGQTRPELIALNKWGKRRPELRLQPKTEAPKFSHKDRISVKVCASNPAVAEQIVADWDARGRRSPWANACQNDQAWGYCRCDNCLALDTRRDGEDFMDHLTDRYVHLANQVARLAKQKDPTAGAVMYAYHATEQPPRQLKVDPNVLVVIVPTTLELDKLSELFGAWKQAGAKTLVMRPNYGVYYETLAIPTGIEEHMYDAFQLSINHGAIAADNDGLTGLWAVNTFTDYILAKSLTDTTKPFSYWEDEYCAAYGEAAQDVKNYYRFWRTEIWNARLRPALGKIVERGKVHNFARGLSWSIGEYYRNEDFVRADTILRKALSRSISSRQRELVEHLLLSNEHSRLTFNAMSTSGLSRFEHARRLLQFRVTHKQELTLNWMSIFAAEMRFGDVTGTRIAEQLKAYPLPWVETGVAWQFKLDPENKGVAEQWYRLSWDEIAKWHHLRTDFFWENPYKSETDPKLMASLKDYNGHGWYATQQVIPRELKGREIILRFGAVDESCWIYVNGQLAGKHLFEKSSDWCTPFEIRIDSLIDWNKPKQQIMVRVEDKSGAGGIWKRVWLVSRNASSVSPN